MPAKVYADTSGPQPEDMERWGPVLDPSSEGRTVALDNPWAEPFSVMRTSLLPSLLKTASLAPRPADRPSRSQTLRTKYAIAAGTTVLAEGPLMAIHPPMLYLGYVGLTAPFAYALGSLVIGTPGTAWVTRTKRLTPRTDFVSSL